MANNDQNESGLPLSSKDNRDSASLLPRIFRTDSNKKFLQATLDQLTPTANFSYAYFYNPSVDLSRRTCVAACPSYVNSSLTNISCYTSGNKQGKCSYDLVVA
jgi:hypothetical protein